MHANDRVRALDGLRGIAIAMVVGYHAAPQLVPGGFIGVSVFFTLSGFLIGSKLTEEWSRTGRVDLPRFWSRRARRLLPAALLTIVATALVMQVRGEFDHDFAKDGFTAASYQQNWHLLSRSGGYGALFDRASPLDHFWSLAIEEQFYIVFPLALLLVLAVVRGRRGWATAILAALAACSFLLPVVLGATFERRYLGTDTRIGEILVGVVIALVGGARLARSKSLARLSVPALGALIAVAMVAAYGSRWFALGLLPISVLTTVVLAGSLRPGSAVERWVSREPLVGLGVISYSLYLVHWPVLVLTGASSPAGVLAAVAVSVLISVALHRLVERPAMMFVPLGRTTLAASVAVTAIVASAILLVGPAAQRDVLAELQSVADQISVDGQLDPAAVAAAAPLAAPFAPEPTQPPPTTIESPQETHRTQVTAPTATPTIAEATTTTVPPPPPPRLGFIGDSVALTLGLAASGMKDPALYTPAKWSVELGCGLARFESTTAIERDCPDPVARVEALEPESIDVAVVVSCQWELLDRRVPGMEGKRDITDPAFQDYVFSEYVRVADALVAAGVDTVLWSICAPMSQVIVPDDLPQRFVDSRSTERGQALAAVVRRVADSHPAVEVLDLGRMVEGRLDDATMRPDGNHFEWKADAGVGAAFNRLLRCALTDECEPPEDSLGLH